MVIVLKRKSSIEQLKAQLEKVGSRAVKGVDTRKYNGILSSGPDGLKHQKSMRDEWK